MNRNHPDNLSWQDLQGFHEVSPNDNPHEMLDEHVADPRDNIEDGVWGRPDEAWITVRGSWVSTDRRGQANPILEDQMKDTPEGGDQ